MEKFAASNTSERCYPLQILVVLVRLRSKGTEEVKEDGAFTGNRLRQPFANFFKSENETPLVGMELSRGKMEVIQNLHLELSELEANTESGSIVPVKEEKGIVGPLPDGTYGLPVGKDVRYSRRYLPGQAG